MTPEQIELIRELRRKNEADTETVYDLHIALFSDPPGNKRCGDCMAQAFGRIIDYFNKWEQSQVNTNERKE